MALILLISRTRFRNRDLLREFTHPIRHLGTYRTARSNAFAIA